MFNLIEFFYLDLLLKMAIIFSFITSLIEKAITNNTTDHLLLIRQNYQFASSIKRGLSINDQSSRQYYQNILTSAMKHRQQEIYVRGYSRQTTKYGDLERLFEKFGGIIDIDIKGPYAFILFADKYDARDAIKAMDNKVVDGCRLIVEPTGLIASNFRKPEKRSTSDSRKKKSSIKMKREKKYSRRSESSSSSSSSSSVSSSNSSSSSSGSKYCTKCHNKKKKIIHKNRKNSKK